ncbi:ABC transporter ATP-binding protein [Oenococcus oeni]|uniref:ABC transporter ATP-binding protein n=1 Tax=Oenococcus oeni TaxID=1247 RepID=UPI000277B755|nr:ABC transporter ATP-binding protein [Oenococcus oeni]EJO08709.1 ABC-type multidrug transport system, ATPase and permease component [Oenococcus oeni AWRIB553]KGH56638.1 multidrug ABC transporter permease [Oenococcus oeni IOEB_B10]KGH70886.1 multidrug ABC transporter permease [Oenococcus oeni IOEB_9517]KGH98918.1 multidrug ABC transporter permease [Oenococcus oeni IOEB_L18_3]KGI01548.1 multidrug ABC transporter permease [Oenococcus oeni IOEB_L65_2]
MSERTLSMRTTSTSRKSKKAPKAKISGLWKIIKIAHPQFKWMIPGLLFSVIGVVFNLMTPKYSGKLINSFSGQSLKNIHLDSTTIALVLALFIGGAIVSAIGNFLTGVAGEQPVRNLREIVWDKLVIFKMPYFDSVKSGETTSRLTSDTSQVKTLVANTLPNFLTSMISMVGAVILMFTTDWHMAIWIFIAVPVTALLVAPVMVLGSKVGRGTQDAMADFTGGSQETLAEMRLVKSSGAEQHVLKRGVDQIQNLFKFGRREAIVDGVMGPIMTMVMMGLFALILVVGSLRVAKGESSMGTLFSFIMYLFQIMPALVSVGTFGSTFAKTQGATHRLIDLLDEPVEELNKGKSVDVEGLTLTADHVDFAYENDQPILHNVSFEAKPNTIVAFAGPSGGGKSTIFQLLERFYQPDQGTINIGNHNIENISLNSWRSQIGFVSQDSSIMAGTIRDNLTYGLKKEFSDERLWEVLQLAYADKFVDNMPKKLDTQVGERGVKVSGGQRQRLAIARAFLRNPKILMLYEATASLDSESEAMVQRALEQLMKNRTTLVIAHRLSTIVDADKIYFIEHGEVTGSGTHQELLKSHELYAEYVSEQFVTK